MPGMCQCCWAPIRPAATLPSLLVVVHHQNFLPSCLLKEICRYGCLVLAVEGGAARWSVSGADVIRPCT